METHNSFQAAIAFSPRPGPPIRHLRRYGAAIDQPERPPREWPRASPRSAGSALLRFAERRSPGFEPGAPFSQRLETDLPRGTGKLKRIAIMQIHLDGPLPQQP